MAERSGQTPSAVSTEADVLGACLSEGAGWWDVVRRTAGEDTASLFYDTHLTLVAHAIEAAVRSSESLSLSTVEDQLAQRGGDSLPSSPREFLLSLQARSNVNSTRTLRSALSILLDKRSSRGMLRSVQDVIQNDILPGDKSSQEIGQSLRMIAADHVVHDREVPTMGEVIDRMESRPQAQWRVPTGLSELDRLLNGGFEPGRYYVVGAGPKVGKTTFCLNCTIEAVVEHDIPVLFVSLEMHDFEIRSKFMAILTGIDHNLIKDIIEGAEKLTSLTAEEQVDFRRADASLRAAKLHTAFVADFGSITTETISSMVLSMRAKYGEDRPILVVVDYLQLLIDSMENRVGQLSQITRTFKLLAMELSLPIITPSQINRKGSESEEMPQVYQLRDGGSIEQDADVIIMLHRQINDDGANANAVLASHVIQIRVARSRVGPSGQFDAHWEGSNATILDLEDDANTSVRISRDSRDPVAVGGRRDDVADDDDYAGDDGYAD